MENTNKSKKNKRTLKQQLFNAIDTRHNFGRGRSKHQDKKNGANKKHNIIYSKTEYVALKDISSDMCNWIKENRPELWRSELANLPVEVCDEFLKSKADTCNQNSLISYRSRLIKIFRCADAVYKTADFSAMETIRTPLSALSEEAELRNIALSREVMNAALEQMDKNSGGYRGNLIAAIIGGRVDEIAEIRGKDIDLNAGTLTIVKGKGSKKRTLTLTEAQIEQLKPILEGVKAGQKVCGCGADAIHQSLKRALGRLDRMHGTDFEQQLKDKKTNTHAVRKMVATEMYNEKVATAQQSYVIDAILTQIQRGAVPPEGVRTIQDLKRHVKDNFNELKDNYIDNKTLREIEDVAWSETCVYLGHGEDRPELKEVYIIEDSTRILSFNQLIFE